MAVIRYISGSQTITYTDGRSLVLKNVSGGTSYTIGDFVKLEHSGNAITKIQALNTGTYFVMYPNETSSNAINTMTKVTDSGTYILNSTSEIYRQAIGVCLIK